MPLIFDGQEVDVSTYQGSFKVALQMEEPATDLELALAIGAELLEAGLICIVRTEVSEAVPVPMATAVLNCFGPGAAAECGGSMPGIVFEEVWTTRPTEEPVTAEEVEAMTEEAEARTLYEQDHREPWPSSATAEQDAMDPLDLPKDGTPPTVA